MKKVDVARAKYMLKTGKTPEQIAEYLGITTRSFTEEQINKWFENQPLSIRGIDLDLYLSARADAIRKNMTIGKWLNEAIREKLGKPEGWGNEGGTLRESIQV